MTTSRHLDGVSSTHGVSNKVQQGQVSLQSVIVSVNIQSQILSFTPGGHVRSVIVVGGQPDSGGGSVQEHAEPQLTQHSTQTPTEHSSQLVHWDTHEPLPSHSLKETICCGYLRFLVCLKNRHSSQCPQFTPNSF